MFYILRNPKIEKRKWHTVKNVIAGSLKWLTAVIFTLFILSHTLTNVPIAEYDLPRFEI